MKYIDLHVHSLYSDGSCTPTELVSLAAKAGLSAFALTDHDIVAGIPEAAQAAAAYSQEHPGTPLTVVPGVEISAAFRDRDIHILGLLIDPGSAELQTALDAARTERDTRNCRMAERLEAAGIHVDMDELKAIDPNSVITRAHFAKYLLMKHYVKDYSTAFTRYLGDETPYYVPRHFIDPEAAIRLIRNAGGVPVLAHPLLYHLGEEDLAGLVAQLAGYGLMGIEAIYSSNTGRDEQNVRHLADRFGLLITGGSDFHGTPKPQIQIGVGRGNLKIPYALLEELRQRAGQGAAQ